MRLIVTDTSTAARVIAGGIGDGPPREFAVHRQPVFEAVDRGRVTRAIGTGGLLFSATGNPPQWVPARRAAIKALKQLAQDTESLVLSCDDPLLAAQARDVACEGRPLLMRAARAGAPPFDVLGHVDDLAAEARAAALEIDAVFSDYLADLDPHLHREDLSALAIAGPNPVPRDVLRSEGVSEDSLARLAERGYLVGEPAWWSPAAALVAAAVPGPVLDPGILVRCDRWVDAVARGTLARHEATSRAQALLEGLARPAAPEGFDAGRLIGQCPECGDWMGGARDLMRCLGCGLTYRLPRGVEALAVPGVSCSVCAAPLIRPVVRGRVDAPRCPDAIGCPSALGARVGT